MTSQTQPDPTEGASPAAIGANTFLIGAQKAGTTYLAALLDQSPDVCVSDPKEPQFYTTNFDDGFDSYARCFRQPEARIRLDASTTYTFLRPLSQMDVEGAPGLTAPVPQRIKDVVPEARFVYVLRDPVKRAASAHRHRMRNEKAPDGPLSLVEAMEQNPMLALVGRYADQIERWFEVFPAERFLFLDFQRLTRDTRAVLDEVCAFLEVDASAITIGDAERGKHGAHRITSTGALLGRAAKHMPGLARTVKAVIPSSVKAQVLDPITKVPSEIVYHDEEAAAAFFEKDRARTFELTGIRV